MKTKSMICILGMLLLVGCATTGARSEAASNDSISLYQRLLPCTATVLVDGRIAGGGAFVSEQGDFLTAAHVVHGSEGRVMLLLPGGRTVPAETLAFDLGSDLALLRTRLGNRSKDQYLRLAPTPPASGARLHLLSAPSMLTEVLLPGWTARERLGFNFIKGRDSYVHSLLIAADAMPGSSGGCWVDGRGRIVGVQSAVLGDGKASQGLSFISPASAAIRLIEQQVDVSVPTLGAEMVTLRTQGAGFIQRFPTGSAGCAVHRILEGGPIAGASIPKDHLITHVDGIAVAETDALLSVVRGRSPGDTLRLTVVAPDHHQVKDYDVAANHLTWD